MSQKKQRIFFLKDCNEYIYDWMAKYFDDDEYDHHSYTIVQTRKQNRRK